MDAAIAAVAAQGVVAPETCGVGGDLFALVHQPGWERPLALNSSGQAGSDVDADSIRAAGHTEIPQDHPAVVTVPGCVDGLAELSARLGSIDLAEALGPAIDLAREGFAASDEQSGAFTRRAAEYASNPAVSEFYPDGQPVQPGALVRRERLARTLEVIGSDGRYGFYLGEPGREIVETIDGIRHTDLERNNAEWVEPIEASVAGYECWTIPPNSQGYLTPAALAVFQMLEPPEDSEDPLWWHLLIESYRAVAWERDDLVSEPKTAPLPDRLLLDQSRLERLSSTVSADRTGVWPRTGAPSDTAHLCVADENGLGVSIIQSNYRGTGSPFGAANSGFLFQDRGGGFNLMPGHPNELRPGKRPLHTLSPTLWTDGDQPRWLLGTRGGAIQPQLLAQVAARGIVSSSGLDEAQQAPRWSIADFGPQTQSVVRLEPGVPAEVTDGLARRGHQLEQMDEPQSGWGPVSVIELDGDSRQAAADPRVTTTTTHLW